MSRFVLSIGNPDTNFDINLFKSSLVQISSKEEIQIKDDGSNLFLYTYLQDEPLKGHRYFSNENWTVFLAGELIDYPTLPFNKIIQILENKSFNEIKNFNGVFAIVAHDIKKDKYYFITDRRSQYPLYYFFKNNTAIISSDLSSFCRLIGDVKFNMAWLYDYMFFHYPIGDDTFLKDVKKLSYSSVMIYCNNKKETIVKKYANVFQKKDTLLKGEDGIEYAKEVFSKRVPKYFEGSDKIACALTGGWDGRTNVALAPDRNKITTYTYGGNDCNDFIFSRKAVKDIKTKHFEILFDDELIENLKRQIFETVYVSSGTQPILRSTLLDVYSKLSNFPLTISGISYDGLFRGNVGGINIISPYLIDKFKNGKQSTLQNDHENIFIGINGELSYNIKSKFDWIENEFGSYKSSESHLKFASHICDPQSFLGEYKIAEQSTTLRVPAWDYEIIDLAFSIEQSTLNFSEFLQNKRGTRKTMVLQANLISQFAPELINSPVKTTNPKSVLSSEQWFKINSKLNRAKFEISKKLFYKNQKPLEDWNNWLNVNHKELVDNLIFAKDSLVQNYFTRDYLTGIKTIREYRTIGKLCTIEILLRFINNNWKRFW